MASKNAIKSGERIEGGETAVAVASPETAIARPEAGTEASRFVALRPGSDIAEAIRWNSLGGLTVDDLTRVPIPAGGATTWAFPDAMGNEVTTKEVTGAFCLFAQQGTLWGSDQPTTGRQPVLVTRDMRTAIRVSNDIGDLDEAVLEAARIGDRTYDWTRLEYAQFGSGRDGRGKRAKEARLIGILREEDGLPLLVAAGPGSIKGVDLFVKRISSLGKPYFHTVVSATVTPDVNPAGQKYGRVSLTLPAILSPAEANAVRDQYTVPLLQSLERSVIVAD